MTQHRADHQRWPKVPDAQPEDIYCPERHALERVTTAFLALLWKQRMIAEKEANETR
jgi:hypothetical protein